MARTFTIRGVNGRWQGGEVLPDNGFQAMTGQYLQTAAGRAACARVLRKKLARLGITPALQEEDPANAESREESSGKISYDHAVWLALLYYFEGAAIALRSVGDVTGQEWARFARLSYGIQEEALRNLRYGKSLSQHPDFLGLMCCMLDDARVRDQNDRARILSAWVKAPEGAGEDPSASTQVFKFHDSRGAPCSLEDANSASDPVVWLGADAGGGHNGRMKLTRGQVQALLPYLQHFAETGQLKQESK
jgi:hypothetical protein